MKILHCLYDHPKNPWVGGGGAQRLKHLYRYLTGKGHKMEIITGAFPGCRTYVENPYPCTFAGRPTGYLQSTFAYAALARTLVQKRHHEFDLVIEDFAPWNALRLPPEIRQKTILQLQSVLGFQILRRYFVAGLPFYWIERRYPRKFRHVIVVGDTINRQLHLQGQVVSNGIDERLLIEQPEDGDYIACMGRLDFAVKGLDLLLKAAAATGLAVRIAGDGPDADRLRKEVAGLPNVTWDGWIEGDAKKEFLRRARFVVVPSRSEGQNMVLLEAAGLAKACLVSDIPGIAYAVEAGFAAAFRSGDADDLAARMKELWQNEGLRQRLAQAGRPHVADKTWPAIGARFEAICLDVLRERTNTAPGHRHA